MPEVSELQNVLLQSMIDKDHDKRPSLADIAKHCQNYFKTRTIASAEIDRLVTYVIGSPQEVMLHIYCMCNEYCIALHMNSWILILIMRLMKLT